MIPSRIIGTCERAMHSVVAEEPMPPNIWLRGKWFQEFFGLDEESFECEMRMRRCASLLNIIAVSHLAFEVSTIFKWTLAKCAQNTHAHFFDGDVRSHRVATRNFHFILMKKTWLFKHSWRMKTITINFTAAKTVVDATKRREVFLAQSNNWASEKFKCRFAYCSRCTRKWKAKRQISWTPAASTCHAAWVHISSGVICKHLPVEMTMRLFTRTQLANTCRYSINFAAKSRPWCCSDFMTNFAILLWCILDCEMFSAAVILQFKQ